MQTHADSRYWRAALAIVAIYVLVFSIFTIGRYERYNATGFDLAFYDQILWRTARGDIMGMTIEGDNWSNWAFHVEPILLLMAPFTLIFSDTRWLLVFQTVILAVGAIPIYRIAARYWQEPWAGFLFAALYLLYPSIGWANKFDFHPLTITTPLFLFAFDAAELKRFRLVSVLLLLAMMCKEEVGLVVACFGLYWYLKGRWRFGVAWAVIGVGWSLLGFFVIIPGAQGKSVLPNQAFLRYSWLFRGTLAEKIAYITGPDTPVKIRFLLQLLVALAFTPLLKPRILFIASPVIALSLLSANLNQSSVYHQYMADVVPFLMIGAIQGTHDAPNLIRRLGLKFRVATVRRALLVAMSIGTLLSFVLFNPFFFVPREPYAPIYGWEGGASLSGLRAAEALIPPDSCLTASNNITAHYGQRTYIYAIGIGNYLDCNLIMVDLADTRFVSFGVPQEYVCKQFMTADFRPIFYQDNVVILRRGAVSTPELDGRLTAYCRKQGKYDVLRQPVA
jgi:uncharacterized membrane protein